MTDINNVLRELNILNSKKNKNNIDKLMKLIKIDQKINKSFSLEITFAFSVLFAVFTSITFNTTIKFITKVFNFMHFNNAHAIIVHDVQRIIIVILCK